MIEQSKIFLLISFSTFISIFNELWEKNLISFVFDNQKNSTYTLFPFEKYIYISFIREEKGSLKKIILFQHGIINSVGITCPNL